MPQWVVYYEENRTFIVSEERYRESFPESTLRPMLHDTLEEAFAKIPLPFQENVFIQADLPKYWIMVIGTLDHYLIYESTVVIAGETLEQAFESYKQTKAWKWYYLAAAFAGPFETPPNIQVAGDITWE